MQKSPRSNRHQVLRKLLVAARDRAGLTQTQLGELIDEHQSFVSKTEIGERRLGVVEFIALTDAMGTDPIKILRAVRKEKP